MPKDQKPPTPPATIPATQYLFPEREDKDDKVPAEGKQPKKGGRLIKIVRGLLPELCPDGFEHLSTETVLQKVIVKLGPNVSWDTVHRALGRAPK